ncbi:MAG: calcium-binding protein, partial [Pseudomonadota bacterium]
MAVGFVITRVGIVVIEAGPETFQVLRQISLSIADDAAHWLDNVNNARDLADFVRNNFTGNTLGAIKVIGAVAAGTAATILLLPPAAAAAATTAAAAGTITVAVATGYLVSSAYEKLFDAAESLGRNLTWGVKPTPETSGTTGPTQIYYREYFADYQIAEQFVPPPDAPTRDSSQLVSASGAHSVTILQTGTRHGGLWDAWKMNPNGFANFNDFVAAVMAANPSITNPNDVKAGQTVYLPERLPDGSTTYHYPNGGSQNLNPINNNCNIVTPDGEGGTIVYRRETDGDAGYSVTEIRTNAQGEATYTVRGYQDTLDGPIRNFTETQNIDTNNDGLPDRIIIGADTTGDGVADQHIDTAGDDGRLSMADLLDADQQLQELYDAGDLDPSLWHDYSDWSVRQLVSPPVIPDMPAFDTPPAPPSFDDFGDLGGYPMNWPTFDPIGAFYDSQSSAFDQAASIANQTPVLLDANYRAVSRGPFAFTNLDTNYDNQLTGNELNGLKVWVDANEDGLISTTNASGVANPATSSEIQSLRAWLSSQRLTALSASDYDRMARGNSRFADTNTSASTTSSNPTYRPTPTLLARPTDSGAPARSNSVAASNYRSLRDNDNRYTYAGGPGQFLWYYIDWQPTHIKINQGTPNSLIGTDNADSMDAAYYPTYLGSLAQFFNLGALTNFYAGGGDDQFGGSTRDDNIWGGTGNDTLYGYAGNDKMYGEEGNDISLGQDGNDVIVDNLGNNQMSGGNGNDYLDAGVGDDLLLGDAGDDTLFGGSGQDELNGGDGTDTLQGEADNDRLFGGAGSDTLWGGAGNDVMLGFTASNDPKQSLSVGETDNDVMFGQDGNDNLYGGLGNDLLDGGTGDDLIAGDAGDDTLWGADGSDALLGDVGNDVLQGGLGDDELQGGAGNDRLLGEDGVDRLFGQSGDDILYGGSGDDILVGFTASNEAQQSLNPGESDNDVLYGGEGSDLLLGQLGDDVLFGETGDDELQGGSGSDALYGGAGVDHLFGQVGDDVLYGGEGDDILMGFTASNETQQRLNLGESDNDQLYGGAGNDLLIGGLGDDFLDGGAGADDMQGGAGNDTYLVNSVNDQILERADEGYDSVIASTNYLLNAQVERLELLEGSALNGTGNAQNNTLIGNNQANILDGVTGTDLMIGQDGDDIYYVDNAGDQTIEQAGQGHDRVQSSISWTLADNLEDLTLLDFAKAEHGLVDGTAVLVYGYPKANELDYMQGDAVDNYFGTCALTSIANLITQTVRPTSEAQIVNLAINNHWALTTQDTTNPYQLGGSNYLGQQAILDAEGIRNKLLAGYNEQALANLIRGGRGVI